MPKNGLKIFLDANIVIGAGKPPGGPEMARVIDLVEAGFADVLTTDITITEVAKKHVQNDFDLAKCICVPHFRSVVAAAAGAILPEMKKRQLKDSLTKSYGASTIAMFQQLKAKCLQIDDVKPSVVFAEYAAGEGFFTGEGKKDQFPDAFIFECLKQEALNGSPIIVVSMDGDFVKPISSADGISLVSSLPELFTTLGLEMEAPGVEGFLDAHKDELVDAVDKELTDLGLQGDVEDSEVSDTTVNEVEIQGITAFRPTSKGDPILVVGRLNVKATASYTHPDWDNASYDSEDKVLIPFDDVSGETEVALEIDVSMSIAVDESGEPEEIEELRFRDDKFRYVALHPYDPYEYK